MIRPHQHRLRDREAQSPSRVEVDHQFVLRRLLHGQVAWLGSLKDLVHVAGSASNLVVKVHRIGHEATSVNKLPLVASCPMRWTFTTRFEALPATWTRSLREPSQA